MLKSSLTGNMRERERLVGALRGGGSGANSLAGGVADWVEVETGDLTRPPFSDAVFDAVISMTVSRDVPSQKKRNQTVREIVRVLESGGRTLSTGCKRAVTFPRTAAATLGREWLT